MPQKQKRLRFGDQVNGEESRREVLRPGDEVFRVGAPIQRRDLVVEVGEGPDELEREELLPEPRRPPYLDELADGDGDAGPVGAELEGGDGALEGNAVEDDVAAEVDEQAAAVVVDGDEEDAVGGGREAGDVGGGLDWEGQGLGLDEVGDAHAVTDR